MKTQEVIKLRDAQRSIIKQAKAEIEKIMNLLHYEELVPAAASDIVEGAIIFKKTSKGYEPCEVEEVIGGGTFFSDDGCVQTLHNAFVERGES